MPTFQDWLDAAIADPSFAVWKSLEDYIVQQVGQTIYEIWPEETAQVIASGTNQQVELTLEGITATLTLTRASHGSFTECSPDYAWDGLAGETLTIPASPPEGHGLPEYDPGRFWYSMFVNIFGTVFPPELGTRVEQMPEAIIRFGQPSVEHVAGSDPVRPFLNNYVVSGSTTDDRDVVKVPLVLEARPIIFEYDPINYTGPGDPERWRVAFPPPFFYIGISHVWRAGSDLAGRPLPGTYIPPGPFFEDGDYHNVAQDPATNIHEVDRLHGGGPAAGTSTTTKADAIADFVGRTIPSFNAGRNLRTPEAIWNPTTGRIEMHFDTHETAIYTPNPGCDTTGRYRAVVWMAQDYLIGSLGSEFLANDGQVYWGQAADPPPFYNPYSAKQVRVVPFDADDPRGGTLLALYQNKPFAYKGSTDWQQRLLTTTPFYESEFIAAEYIFADGKPPDTVPNPTRPPATGTTVPVPTPQSGGCRSMMDDPASCDYNIPFEPDWDDPPMPGDNFEFPDDFDFPDIDMPLIDTDFPEFPDFCGPDFGNLSDCGPAPGSAHNPGGRDRKGKRGRGIMHSKTGGNLYGKDDDTFNQDIPEDPITGEIPEDPDTGEPVVPPQRSWPAGSSVMTAVTTILLDLGVSPLNIVWEIGVEWDKVFGPLTFPTTTGMLDAARSLAEKLMCRIIDEGPPTNKVYIGPPTHRPQSQTFTFADVYYPGFSSEKPFSNLTHGYSSQEAAYAVKVWGPFAGSPAWAVVDTPFSRQDPSQILEIEVGPDYTFAEAQEKAFFHAALIRRGAVSVQTTVPYNINYFIRDTMVLHHTEDGVMETYTIFGKQSEVSLESEAHVLTGVLPATLAELDQFPDLLPDPQPLEAAFLEWPLMRAATKRKGERRLRRHLKLRDERQERRVRARERDRQQVEVFKSMLGAS